MTAEPALLDAGEAGSARKDISAAPRQPAIWFEAEDVIRHFDFSLTPSGIQRVCHEFLIAVARELGARARFCRLSLYSRQFEVIDLASIHTALTKPVARHGPCAPFLPPGSLATKLKGILPALLGRAAWLKEFLGQIAKDMVLGRRQQRAFEQQVSPGDVIVCLGLPCRSRRHSAGIAVAKARTGAKYALLIHDLIPVTEKAISNPFAARRFGAWLEQAVAQADLLFTVSAYSRTVLRNYAREKGWKLPPIEVLRLGCGFGAHQRAGDGTVHRLPEDYVLFVSTIEIRKNHALAFRIWRKLIDRHGADAVPTLLFIGSVGWLVDDFVAELKASRYLGGKIQIMSGLSDAELAEAYRRCRFTVFPSLYEGWGLPIAESLSHGKFCIASNRTSLPEVGGDFVDYIDPADEAGALQVFERALFEKGYVPTREAHIKKHYHPATWADSVRDLVVKVDAL